MAVQSNSGVAVPATLDTIESGWLLWLLLPLLPPGSSLESIIVPLSVCECCTLPDCEPPCMSVRQLKVRDGASDLKLSDETRSGRTLIQCLGSTVVTLDNHSL
ncbi:hypothetical protein DNTS_031713 [Danionella cerebrum]|uniref:Uncharacterized protein n=1 Tax=Danionella cerebrum TaxID=2873325 RepID=A0A553QB75_9TELE|nr:hypothetical protein DNTS_031713 [Danionella translucida]